MGIVQDKVMSCNEDIRKASSVMVRSIKCSAEFWMKVGMPGGGQFQSSLSRNHARTDAGRPECAGEAGCFRG